MENDDQWATDGAADQPEGDEERYSPSAEAEGMPPPDDEFPGANDSGMEDREEANMSDQEADGGAQGAGDVAENAAFDADPFTRFIQEKLRAKGHAVPDGNSKASSSSRVVAAPKRPRQPSTPPCQVEEPVPQEQGAEAEDEEPRAVQAARLARFFKRNRIGTDHDKEAEEPPYGRPAAAGHKVVRPPPARGRVAAPPAGRSARSAVEQFILENKIDARAAHLLREASPSIQEQVLAEGVVIGTNTSAITVARVRNASSNEAMKISLLPQAPKGPAQNTAPGIVLPAQQVQKMPPPPAQQARRNVDWEGELSSFVQDNDLDTDAAVLQYIEDNELNIAVQDELMKQLPVVRAMVVAGGPLRVPPNVDKSQLVMKRIQDIRREHAQLTAPVAAKPPRRGAPQRAKPQPAASGPAAPGGIVIPPRIVIPQKGATKSAAEEAELQRRRSLLQQHLRQTAQQRAQPRPPGAVAPPAALAARPMSLGGVKPDANSGDALKPLLMALGAKALLGALNGRGPQ